ncbi:DMT family transporter [Gemmatimonas sp.]|uniref:DMT family transporter n=1 Tax=Gemmatimonas sp. TaxID=1962908 RepID=UPI00356AB660
MPLPAAMPASSSPSESPVSRRAPVLVLAASLIGISFAAPLIRLSASSAIVIAAWRLGLSMLIVIAALLITGSWREWRMLSRRELFLASGAGVLLALHFWSWNASLRFTSVAASVALVNLQPVLIAGVSALWLHESPSGRQWLGVVIAVIGALVVGLADVPGGLSGIVSALSGGVAADGSGRALFGDFLALVGAVTAALYYLIGRRLRQRVGVWPYVSIAYGAAFVTCVAIALASGEVLLPQPRRELSIFAGLAIGPMLLGHTGMNWALGHLPAFVVNLTTLGEPIGATILAALLPGIAEVPGVGTIVGGVLVLGGVLLASRRSPDQQEGGAVPENRS